MLRGALQAASRKAARRANPQNQFFKLRFFRIKTCLFYSWVVGKVGTTRNFTSSGLKLTEIRRSRLNFFFSREIIRICSCLGPSSARKTILRPLLYVNDEHIAILKWSQKFDRTTERSRNGYFKVKFGPNHKFFTRKHPAKKFYSSDTPKAPSPVSTITQSLQMSLKHSKATRADSRRSIMQKYAPYSY